MRKTERFKGAESGEQEPGGHDGRDSGLPWSYEGHGGSGFRRFVTWYLPVSGVPPADYSRTSKIFRPISQISGFPLCDTTRNRSSVRSVRSTLSGAPPPASMRERTSSTRP